MQERMFEGKDSEDKILALRDTCDKVENFSYEKAFTNKDVLLFQERLSTIMIDVSKIEAELAKVKKTFTEQMKPLKAEIKELLNNINFRSQTVEEPVYIFIDHEQNKVGYYNGEGLLVHTRMLKIEEHQRSIMGSMRGEEEYVDTDAEVQ